MSEDERSSLVAEIVAEVNKTVEAKIENLVNPRLDSVAKQVHSLQKTVDQIDKDLEDDRKDIGDWKNTVGEVKNQLASVKLEFEEMRGLFHRQTRTIVEKVSNHVSESIESASELVAETAGPAMEAVLDNFVAGKPRLAKKAKGWLGRFFSRLKFRKKGG